MFEVSDKKIITDHFVDFGRDAFLKIPVPRYLELRGIEAIPPQIALTNAVNDPAYRFIVAILARRTGKTFISNIIGHLVTLVPRSNVLIMSPNYSLSQISWELQRSMLKEFDIELERSNAKDKIIELKNGSTIRMGSVTQADSVVGRSYDLIIFDEAALEDKGQEAFNIRLLPTLDKANSKCIFISTPRGKNWLYELYKRGWDEAFPEWVSIRSSYHENPRVDPRTIEEAKRSVTNEEFRQEYLADFVAMQGSIFNLNRDCIVDLDTSEIATMDVIAGLDIGYRDATAFCVVLTDGYKFYIVDEYRAERKPTPVHANNILQLEQRWGIDYIYIDSANQQTRADLAYDWGISTWNANKSKLDGIAYVSSIIQQDRLIIDSKCVHCIDALDNVVWDDRPNLEVEKPKRSEYLHMADAIRYALYSHSTAIDTLSRWSNEDDDTE